MADFTIADVKTLREKTGAGMMDAKKALTETGGDIEAAVNALRAKGLAAAQKKSSRTAAEGLVGVAVEGTKGVAVEVNSETDFVAKNDKFQDFVRNTTEAGLKADADDVEALKGAAYPEGGTVGEKLTDNVATIGENQQIRRMKTVSVENGVVVPYMHNAVAPNLGKIGVWCRVMPVQTCWSRWGRSGPRTSPQTRRRSTPMASMPTSLPANAPLHRKRPPKAASPKTCRKRWSTARSRSSPRKTRFFRSCS